MSLNIIGNFVHFILLDRFGFVQIPFGIKVKFQSLAQFPADHLLYPVIPSLLLLWCQFIVFTYKEPCQNSSRQDIEHKQIKCLLSG